MESLIEKLLFISKLNNLSKNLRECERLVNKVNQNYNVNEINYNLVKTLKISVECNAFDVNEDKQSQCYKQLKCFWPKCRYSAKELVHLNGHISRHLNERQFVCDECNKQFNRYDHLIDHKLCVHSNDRPFACDRIDCNKTFKTKSRLTQHKSTHSSVKSFGCNKCDKRFKTNSNLNYHKKFVHSNIRQFVCPQINCNKRYKRKFELKEHKRIHCSDKPFECEECNQRFKLKSHLKAHKLIHSNVKQFIYDVNDCNKSFRYKSNLNDHKIRNHSDIKRHKCFHNNCDKRFVTSTELKQHICHKHSTETLFECNFHNCNSSFKSQITFNNHKKRVHLINNV